METLQQALAQQRNPLLLLFNNFNSLRSSALLEYLKLSLPLMVGTLQTITCVAVRVQKPARRVGKLSEGFELEHTLLYPGDLLTRALN